MSRHSPISRRTLRRSVLAAAVCAQVLGPLYSEQVLAESKIAFDIPAQPLSQALVVFGKQSGRQVLYRTEMSADLRSRPLKGRYTVGEAAELLLGEAPLKAVVTDNGAITLERRPTPAKPAPTGEVSGAATLQKVTVTAKPETPLDSPYNTSYTRPDATTATKMDTPVMETPYSVAVLTQQVLRDQQVIRVEDAIQNVAGVQSSWTNGGASDVFIMRGFQNTNLYRDGFLLPSVLGGASTKQQTANIERIEVLKGPGSILFGRNEPGGVINMVTKRPLATPYYSLQQQFGSFDLYRTTADATGPITKDDSLLYRVNLSYEGANSFRDFVKTDTVFLAPSLTWNLSPQTQFNVDIQYQHFDDTNDSGIPPIGNRPAPVPISRQTGEPLNNKNKGDRTYFGFNWSHAFNDDWKLTHRFGTEFLDKYSEFTFFFTPATPDGNLVNLNNDFSNGGSRGFNNGVTHQQQYYTTLNLTGKFDTGFISHSTFWGFDYFMFDNQDSIGCCAAYPIGGTFNIFRPVYQTALPFIPLVPNSDYSQEWYGLYFQDQIKLPFNIYGNVGVRYDNASSRNNANGVYSDDDHVSPRGGLLWRPVQWLSLYGSYSENFGPSNSLFNFPGQTLLPPQLANQWELGTKTEFFDGRLTASFAYFDLTKTNVPVPDPVIPNLQRSIGEQESRGYEIEVAGQILPGWSVIGAYTNLAYANINKDVGFDGGPGNTGNRMFNAPRNFGSLWSTYEFQSGDLQGLRFGGGIRAASQAQGTNENTFQLPGYVTFNLMAAYSMKVAGSRLTLQLNADNLLDHTYYRGTNTGQMIGVAPPRTFLGSVRVEF